MRTDRRHFLVLASAATVTACGGDLKYGPALDAATDGGRQDAAQDAAQDTTPDASPDATPDAPATDTACNPAGDDFGAVADFPVGHYALISSLQVILGRDAGGLYAYTASCTHTGCTVPAPGSVTALSTCPCHSSRFNSNGVVQPGSIALRDLHHFALAVCNGRIFVDRFTLVPAGTRQAV